MEIPDFGFLSRLEDLKTPGFKITRVKPVDLVLVTLMYANVSQTNSIASQRQLSREAHSLLALLTSPHWERFIVVICCSPVGCVVHNVWVLNAWEAWG